MLYMLCERCPDRAGRGCCGALPRPPAVRGLNTAAMLRACKSNKFLARSLPPPPPLSFRSLFPPFSSPKKLVCSVTGAKPLPPPGCDCLYEPNSCMTLRRILVVTRASRFGSRPNTFARVNVGSCGRMLACKSTTHSNLRTSIWLGLGCCRQRSDARTRSTCMSEARNRYTS